MTDDANGSALRVTAWTTGNVIRQAVPAILGRDDMVLVGAYAHSAQKAGVDVGTLCRLDRELGVTATTDVDELLGLGLDAIVYSPLPLDVAELERILGAGVNVVASAEFITGATLEADDRARLESACAAGGASLFGSGMNPGYAQLLAAIGTGVTSGVERVAVSESVDVSQYVTDANFEAAGWPARPMTPATPTPSEKGPRCSPKGSRCSAACSASRSTRCAVTSRSPTPRRTWTCPAST